MEKLIIEIDINTYSVEFEEKNGWYDGNVYSIGDYETLENGDIKCFYASKSVGGDTHEEINEDCRIMFGFLFVWRGVWEGRIYFKDDEYWSNEIREMADLWDKIEPILQEKIKQANPEYEFID